MPHVPDPIQGRCSLYTRLRRPIVLIVLLTWALGSGWTAFGREPANLDSHKEEVRAYVKSGEYIRDIEAITIPARTWLEERAAKRSGQERLTMIFDLDETLLSNLSFILEQDFGGSTAERDAWEATGRDTAIEPVRELYRTARRLGIDVVFLTGRREYKRPVTEKNLQAIGCGDYAALLMKPNELKQTATAYKTAVRQRLVAEGRIIIANIGDQQSDLAGGNSERTFKLPNPFYFTP